MKKISLCLVLLLVSLFGCYTAGYVNVQEPTITAIRQNKKVGMIHTVVITLSNPETYSVQMSVACYTQFMFGQENEGIKKTVVVEPRSDKDVVFYTTGSLECEVKQVE